MERKIVKKIGNLEMDDKGKVYKTSKGGFIPPPLPDIYKIPYPKEGEKKESVCGIYTSEIEDAALYEDIDQMNALKEIKYQKNLELSYRELQRRFNKQERKKLTRNSLAFIIKAFRRYHEYRR